MITNDSFGYDFSIEQFMFALLVQLWQCMLNGSIDDQFVSVAHLFHTQSTSFLQFMVAHTHTWRKPNTNRTNERSIGRSVGQSVGLSDTFLIDIINPLNSSQFGIYRSRSCNIFFPFTRLPTPSPNLVRTTTLPWRVVKLRVTLVPCLLCTRGGQLRIHSMWPVM